jgi:hypothetical protein
METVTIHIPDKKSELVKSILRGLGVKIQEKSAPAIASYKDKITAVGIWSDEDATLSNDARKSFDSLKPDQW